MRAATETTNAIINEVGDSLFSILIDESRDISIKEQMVVVLRYVDKRGYVIERFLCIVHVTETTAISLKAAVDEIFSKHGLSITRLRGQGYDGASNMQETQSSWFVLHLVSNVVNVVGASCKRRDILREKQADKVIEALSSGELSSGQGLNQETSLKRAGDTRWGSHYDTLISFNVMFSAVIDVLEIIDKDGSRGEQRIEANALLDSTQSFEFAFFLHLMKNILGITNELSKALQRKEQDIVNAMALVRVSKQRLQMMRDNEWDSLLTEVSLFCVKQNIAIPNMDDKFVAPGTELLLCMACLDPSDSFCAFDKQKLIRLAEFYPVEFSAIDLMALDNQLQTYIMDMRSNSEFSDVKGISGLAEKMVKTRKNILYPLIYLLVTLALILPVATATVERAFSAMKIIKNRLRNRIGDEWMNDCLVVHIEKDIFDSIENEAIIQRFQNMKTRRGQL
ncbi:hypothetical protein HHK36_027211 [Tetracentron sinense]|uniref:Zinc finger MYM-type protein 1-like n=1 Tax=Tetracentron sinense TaxID=13715 RepID=A0A834YMR6_TETSI|nr:hypothetical protein HHK36_027211 [Tetracentron sinense]